MSGIQEYSTDVEEIKAWAIKEMDSFWSIKSRSIPAQNQAAGQARYESLKAAVLAHTDPAWWQNRFASATCATRWQVALVEGRAEVESQGLRPL